MLCYPLPKCTVRNILEGELPLSCQHVNGDNLFNYFAADKFCKVILLMPISGAVGAYSTYWSKLSRFLLATEGFLQWINDDFHIPLTSRNYFGLGQIQEEKESGILCHINKSHSCALRTKRPTIAIYTINRKL